MFEAFHHLLDHIWRDRAMVDIDGWWPCAAALAIHTGSVRDAPIEIFKFSNSFPIKVFICVRP